jgi:hypothetical protein
MSELSSEYRLARLVVKIQAYIEQFEVGLGAF